MKRNLLLLIFLLSITLAFGQQPPGSCPGDEAILTSLCSEACVLCEIDGYTGENSITTPGQAPPGFCAPQLHNTQWIGFVAGSTSLSMDISVFNCNQGDGLQIGIYNTLDCTDFTLVSNCEAAVPGGTTATFNAGPLDVGGIYFIVIDGNFGDICEFDIDITSGSGGAPDITGETAPIIPPAAEYCPGGVYDFTAILPGASIFDWTLDGTPVGYEQVQSFTFTEGSHTICVTPSNPCYGGDQSCTTINVQPLPPIIDNTTICEGQVYTVGNQTFSTSGNFTVPTTDAQGCQQDILLNLNVVPPVYTSEQADMCLGEVYWVGTPGQPGSQVFTSSGQYEVLLPSSVGCDSIVSLDLTVYPNYFEIVSEDICEGESVTITDGINSYTYDESGSYENLLQSSQGCDSMVILVLNVSPEPEPEYVEEVVCPGEGIFIGDFLYYDQTGIYNATIESVGGCDSVVTVNLTVLEPNVMDLTADICAGETYSVGNSDYTTTGTYQDVLTSAAGCDSTINLNLTVVDAIETELTIDICDGESYDVGSSTYNSTGEYEDVLTAANGCDSIVFLDLMVNQIPETSLTETVCFGETYSVGGSTYDASGSYEEVLTAASGCDSIINLSLTVLDEITTFISESVCDGATYTLGSSTFDSTGVYTETLVAPNGCDSIVTLDLTVNEIPETFLDVSICDDDTYQVGNSTYNTEGQYMDVLTGSNGCDSIVHLDLSVITAFETYLVEEICTGQSYTIGNDTYSTSGSYETQLTASIGCDSFVYLDLTVSDILEEYLEVEICEGEDFTIGSSTYDATGQYDEDFVTSEGCDSVVYLDLIVNEIPETFLTESICDGNSFTVGTSNFTTTGTYIETLTSSLTGCDSIVQLDLTVLDVPETFLVESICDGNSFAVGSSSYNSTGTYQDILTAANGCDSIVNLELAILDVPETFLTESICDGAVYEVGASSYNIGGSYQDILTAANGCDSIVNLDLSILDVPETSLTEAICDGEVYEVGNASFTTSGVYTETLVATNGCDSIITLDLTVNNIPVTDIETSICIGATYSVGDSTYTETGSYQNILTSSVGCDSIVNLDLAVTDFYETNLLESICDGSSYFIGNSEYSETGTYQDIFTSQDGCDSIVNLDLTVLDIPVTQLVNTICDGDTVFVGSSTYTSTGEYQDVLTAFTGCDSIVNLALTVDPVFETNLTEAICDGESYPVGSSTYLATGEYQDVLTSTDGCDSIVNLNLTVYEIPETFLTETLCFGESYMVGNTTFDASGAYTEVLTAATGCDSIVYLDLTIDDEIVTELSDILCNGDSYTVGSSTYSATGTYQDVLTASNGCDSIVMLDLVVRDLIETSLVEEICDGEEYPVGSSLYTTTGSYQEVLTSYTGCDSIVNLDLTVNEIPETFLTQSICDGEDFPVGSSSYATSGEYTDVLTAASGCDSIVYLDLTVIEIPEVQLTHQICDGASITVGDNTYTETGTYTDVLTASTGCDSIVYLDLTVLEILETSLTESVCDGESFTVGNSTYTESGSYQDVLTATTGCDSIIYLDLTVNEVYEVFLEEYICEGDTYTVGTTNFAETGTYQEALTSVYGCDSIVNLVLRVYPCELALNMDSDPANCNGDSNGSITFSIDVGTPPYSYIWDGASGSGEGVIDGNGVQETIEGLAAGDYNIVVTDSFNIVGIIDAMVEEPTALSLSMEISDYGSYNTSCVEEEDGYVVPSVAGGTPPYNYAWSTGSTQSDLQFLAPGAYTLSVTDQNGCEITGEAILVAPPPLTAEVAIVDPACFGDSEGLIEVTSASGGVGPYLYSIDDQPFTSSNFFPNLPVGSYEITVQDINGCIWEEQYLINQPEELIVDLGEDIRITLGQDAELFAQTTYPVVDYIWKSRDSLSCDTCINVNLTPFETTTAQVTVIDENGCTDTDEINIFVAKERDVFIPNIFSPNGDGQNDDFMIFAGPEVQNIKSFLIFNRWGETMYELYDFAPNAPNHGWDGTHRGQLLNGGVYVYMAEIEFIDGEVILFKGDVVLFR